jgi:hypothetical protein
LEEKFNDEKDKNTEIIKKYSEEGIKLLLPLKYYVFSQDENSTSFYKSLITSLDSIIDRIKEIKNDNMDENKEDLIELEKIKEQRIQEINFFNLYKYILTGESKKSQNINGINFIGPDQPSNDYKIRSLLIYKDKKEEIDKIFDNKIEMAKKAGLDIHELEVEKKKKLFDIKPKVRAPFENIKTKEEFSSDIKNIKRSIEIIKENISGQTEDINKFGVAAFMKSKATSKKSKELKVGKKTLTLGEVISIFDKAYKGDFSKLQQDLEYTKDKKQALLNVVQKLRTIYPTITLNDIQAIFGKTSKSADPETIANIIRKTVHN